MSPVGTQNKGESSHFAIESKSTFPKVTGGHCWLHLLFKKHETKSNYVLFFKMVAPTVVVCPPALLLTSLEKNC